MKKIKFNKRGLIKLETLLFFKDVWDMICFVPVSIRHVWNRIWVKKDEFHSSLNMDSDYLLKVGITSEKSKEYMRDLVDRRQIAHERDLN